MEHTVQIFCAQCCNILYKKNQRNNKWTFSIIIMHTCIYIMLYFQFDIDKSIRTVSYPPAAQMWHCVTFCSSRIEERSWVQMISVDGHLFMVVEAKLKVLSENGLDHMFQS